MHSPSELNERYTSEERACKHAHQGLQPMRTRGCNHAHHTHTHIHISHMHITHIHIHICILYVCVSEERAISSRSSARICSSAGLARIRARVRGWG